MRKFLIIVGLLAALAGAAWWKYGEWGVIGVGFLLVAGLFLYVRAKMRGWKRKQAEVHQTMEPTNPPQGGGVQFTAKVEGLDAGGLTPEFLAQLDVMAKAGGQTGVLAEQLAQNLLAQQLLSMGVSPQILQGSSAPEEDPPRKFGRARGLLERRK